MNVLCISAFCPHERADSAGVLDVHHMLRYLGARHRVTVICPVSAEERRFLPTLEAVVHRVVPVKGEALEHGWRHAALSAMSLLSPLPAIAFLANGFGLRRAVRQVTDGGRFDVAHLAFTQSIQLRGLLPAGVPAVIDESDVAFERRRRFADTVSNPLVRGAILWDCIKLRRYELRGLEAFDAVLLRTQREADLLGTMARLRRVQIVPPWVDVSFRDTVPALPTARDVLFFGALWRPVNDDAARWMASEVFPLVRARVPDSRLLLVGSRPSRTVRALAGDGVEVPGYVDAVAPYYARSAVVVAPLRAGSGIKGKVLQALGVGRPVVATPIGAEGIDASEADGLFVRDGAGALADAIVERLVEPPGRWYEASRRYFDGAYHWEAGCRAWEALLCDLAGRPRSR